MEQKIKELQRTLGLFFKHAYEERASLTFLYEKSADMEIIIREIDPGFETRKELEQLVDALGFAYQLHDEETQKDTTIKEKLYRHYTNLLQQV